jgi:hypothetical protein
VSRFRFPGRASGRPGNGWDSVRWTRSPRSIPSAWICCVRPQPLPGLLASHLARWCTLTPAARAQLAASPYLLVDAGFDDEQRWLWPGRRMVRDLRRDLAAPFFIGEHVGDFVRRVLMFGWHLARANRQLARVVLGMTPACAAHVAALQLRDLDWLAEHQPGWVRPRWERHPDIWRDLLRAADGDDDAQIAQVSLRGLQLMAGGVLAAARRNNGPDQ